MLYVIYEPIVVDRAEWMRNAYTHDVDMRSITL